MSSVLMENREDLEPSLESARNKALDRRLLIASRQFANEHRVSSWWHFATTLTALLVCVSVATFVEMTWIRALGSILAGLTLVRMFIIYHDYQHQAILKGSPIAATLLSLYGYLMLTPPSVWRRSHDHHHRNNSKLFGASIGSFPIMTTANYLSASRIERFEYRLARSPFVIVFGYLTVFMFGMCIRPLLLDPRRHLDALASLSIHFGVITFFALFWDWQTALLAFVVPTWIATSTGAYLFYVQHNFMGAKIRRCEEWSYTEAALKSSSYLEMGPIMQWLTGNIGFHHVHHLNAKIPFYRLPEAMSKMVELQSPVRTSLRLRDIFGCLQLKLWDTALDRFVTFSDARIRA